MQIGSSLPPAQQGTPLSGARAAAGGASDYQTFLTMLTVQMQNQDPLHPMAATDFAQQLATFATVEQQTRTNSLLTALVNRSGLADMGAWVGMDARIEGEGWFDGQPLSLDMTPAAGADRAVLVVTDAMGSVVDRRQVAVTPGSHDWPGTGSDGLPLPAGRYAFSLESRVGDQILAADPVAVYQPIREVRAGGEGPLLVLAGGLIVDSLRVSGLRQPGV